MNKNIQKRYDLEREEKWNEIWRDIPELNFKEDWGVRIIPPFSGAVARFLIMKGDEQICSVYLDWFDNIGFVGEPYYEVYPMHNDVGRYTLNEVDEMLGDIDKAFKGEEQ